MPEISSLLNINENFDTGVIDQWDLLHNGADIFPETSDTLKPLHGRDIKLGVLSNSEKKGRH